MKSLKEKFKKVGNGFLNVLFPPLCINCEKYDDALVGGLVCRECLGSLNINSAVFCTKCNSRRTNLKVCHDGELIIGSAASYEASTARKLIHTLKYKSLKSAVEPMEEIMSRYLENLEKNEILFPEDAVVVPIPLHRPKKRRRGFNQAELIAEIVTSRISSQYLLDLPLERGVLVKTKPTERQADISDYEKRSENVKGAFKVVDKEAVKNRTIILVDDVFTSGATMREAAKTLKNAGARRVIGIVIAKA